MCRNIYAKNNKDLRMKNIIYKAKHEKIQKDIRNKTRNRFKPRKIRTDQIKLQKSI